MNSLFWMNLAFACFGNLVADSFAKHTAATYLYNVDLIIHRQLENPVEEDAQDLKDNIDEYIKLLGDLLNNVRRRDPVGIQTADEYWEKGTPQFFQEERSGDTYLKLTEEFSWSEKCARELTILIDKAKFLWSAFETWHRDRDKVFRQF